MTADDRTTTPVPRPGHLPVRLRGPADMAEMLPYLLGFFPDDSIVAVGLQGPGLDQGGVIRVDIPDDPGCWERTAEDCARLLIELSEQRERRPAQVLLYLCRDPADKGREPGTARAVLNGLRPLAAALTRAFQAEQVVVKEALCVSAARWWSYLCTEVDCCPPDGTPVREAHHPSPLAAAATFAGFAPRGSRKAIVAGLAPVGPPTSEVQRAALEDAGPPFIRELAAPGGRGAAVERTAALLAEAAAEFRAGARELDAARTARILIGLQDKLGRDRAAEYAEPDELVGAQRLWKFLVRRCVDPFEHLAAPPMTLLAWTSWLAGDSATARIVLARALELEPGYTLAQLLYESLNSGIDPEALLRVVRRERTARLREPADAAPGPDTVPGPDAEPEPAPEPGPSHRPDPVPPDPVPPGPATDRADRWTGAQEHRRSDHHGDEQHGREHRDGERGAEHPEPCGDGSGTGDAPDGDRPAARADGPSAPGRGTAHGHRVRIRRVGRPGAHRHQHTHGG
ncbi:DUF4192 domain-containing protein [Kitasatospora sp. NPDC088391]|uniref:DUF4192 domain-containing protein n=1 Tax=Kitasatospora sp. NPDC088391 TaxID=3364074 RepID=UPI0038118910